MAVGTDLLGTLHCDILMLLMQIGYLRYNEVGELFCIRPRLLPRGTSDWLLECTHCPSLI